MDVLPFLLAVFYLQTPSAAKDVKFFNQFHRHHQYPFINIASTEINSFKHSIVQASYLESEDENSVIYEEVYNRNGKIFRDT